MIHKKMCGILAVIMVIILTASCAPGNTESSDETESTGNSEMANPASVYCEEQGGTLEIRDTDLGQIGYCLFDDGSECEEWAFFRGECAIGGAKLLQPSEPEENSVTGGVTIEGTELLTDESDPVQVTLRITGEMPTPCDQLQVIINPPDADNNIKIELNAWQPNSGFACAQVMTPFFSNIDIPTDSLQDGSYSIFVNGEVVATVSYPTYSE